MQDIVVIGSGGFSKQVVEIIEQLNVIDQAYRILGIIDDNPKKIKAKVLGYPVIGDTDYIKEYSKNRKLCGVIAIADGEKKESISRKLNNIEWVNLIHPSAVISNHIKIGKGNIICAGVVINPEITI